MRRVMYQDVICSYAKGAKGIPDISCTDLFVDHCPKLGAYVVCLGRVPWVAVAGAEDLEDG